MKHVDNLIRSIRMPKVSSLSQDVDLLFANADRKSVYGPELGATTPHIHYEFYRGDQPLGYLTFYASGMPWLVHPYRNGFRQEFSECGKLLKHQEYRDGEQVGISLNWHKNGVLTFAGQIEAEQPISACWSQDGVLIRLVQRLAKNSTSFVCLVCQHDNLWEGHGHAGFAGRGFLYNEDGNFVFSWGAYDAAYHSIVREAVNPWCLSERQRTDFEARIKPAPSGGRFLFANPGRCDSCKAPIASPLPENVYLYDRNKMIETGDSNHYRDGPLSKYIT